MGTRLYNEVVSYFEEILAEENSLITKCKDVQATKLEIYFSFIGHSLGGLISRFALRSLLGDDSVIWKEGDGVDVQKGPSLFKIVENSSLGVGKKMGLSISLNPLSFMTVCTPHCGSRRASLPTWIGKNLSTMVQLYSSNMMGITGTELFMKDGEVDDDENFRTTSPAEYSLPTAKTVYKIDKEPVLWRMAKSNGPYMGSLSHFKTHTLVACLQNDLPGTCIDKIV
ncbi:hypothetical protein HK096_000701 [Nowakowskiella sp. JEL0078]|nr:hypothetical protein HK096_000701 [Nowakowskiella sp. JEL0078]